MKAQMIDPKGWVFTYINYDPPMEVPVMGWRWNEQSLQAWPIVKEGDEIEVACQGPEYSIRYDLGKWELLARG